jgi:photosystem II stability/assembly factor-like uncharacterized protein
MKNYLVTTALLLCGLQLFAQQTTTTIPSGNREGDADFKREREAWIEQMHRTSPDIQWKIIERENREARQMKQDQILKNKSEHILADTALGSWIERGSNNLAGRMLATEIDWDTREIYAAGAGGNVWRGTMQGKNWTVLNDYRNFGYINTIRIVKTVNGKRLYICGDNPYFRYSDDMGKTWTEAKGLEVVKSWGGIRRAVFSNDGKNTIYLIGTEWDYSSNWRPVMTLYRSTDNGATFTNIKRTFIGNQNVADVYVPRYDNTSDVYWIRKDSLSKFTPDLQEEFIGIVNVPEIATAGDVTLFGKSTKNLAIGVASGGKSQVYTSKDQGNSWKYKGSLGFEAGKLTFGMSTIDETYLYAGGVDMYRSIDGGANWQIINSWGEYYGDIVHKLHADIQVVNSFASPDGDEITLISNDGGIYFSEDLVNSVMNISLEGLGVSQYYSTLTSTIDPKVVFAGSQDQGYQKTMKDTNGLLTFEQKISGDYGHLSSGDGGNSFWMDYPGFIDYHYGTLTEEKSASWDWGKNGVKGALWLPPVRCEPNTSDIAYFAGGTPDSGAYLYKITTLYNGLALKAEKLPYNFINAISAIGISNVNPEYRYIVTTSSDVFYSTDKGDTWTKSEGFKSPGNHYFYGTAICPSPVNPQRVYIGGSGYSNPGVYVSNDGGKTFDTMNVGLPKTMIFGLAASPDDKFLFAATQNGAWMYSVEKGRWFDITTNQAPDHLYWSVEYVPALKIARFGTYGRGIWDYSHKEFATVGVDEGKESTLDFPLTVFPNPIVHSAVIKFELPTEGVARLRIYDISGKIVAEPFHGLARKGENSIQWDKQTFMHTSLPVGKYICTLTALGKVQFVSLVVE